MTGRGRVAGERIAIRYTCFLVCCASAVAPHAISATTIAKSPAHFRFWILRRTSVQVFDFRFSEQGIPNEIRNFLCTIFSSIENLKCHLMTLSGLASTFGGMVRPICFAVFKKNTQSER